jgi:RNA polymerase sigma-70 factor (ECF subfamily)
MDPPDPDDRDLMEAFRRGDRASLDALVERHHGSLVRYFHVQGRSRELAEDLAQEVWIRVIRHRDDYRPTARFQAYLFSIARNLWIDAWRSRKAAPPTISADAPAGRDPDGPRVGAGIPSREPEPPALASVQEEAARVRAALERLPEGLRAVFELGEVQDLAYRDIAEILDIPVGTVKSRMFAAVRRLREDLEGPPGRRPPGKEAP